MFKTTEYDSFIEVTDVIHPRKVWIRTSTIIIVRDTPKGDKAKSMIILNNDSEFYVAQSVKTIMEAMSGQKLDD